MDFSSVLTKNDPHQRTIVHLDMDYFYAQVEEIRNPELRTKPLGIQQKNIVVTCNYIAREMGVKKLMLVSEAKHICPSLVLVNGEDLAPYRKMSQQIFDVLQDYSPMVEKLGFDENFIDVTTLVEQRRHSQTTQRLSGYVPEIIGCIYPNDGTASLYDCPCGCAQRLSIGTLIAKEIRDDLYARLGITCCAGISYNKLLAKLVGSQNKPNQQTVLVSTMAEKFMRDLKELNRITGIGQKTQSLLIESGISSIEDLQLCDIDFLKKKFGLETATKIKDLSFGRDKTPIRPTGKPKSIGLEDSCRPISLRGEVEERFRLLLLRLMEQVAEDGRIPIAIKVMLRKFDNQKKTSHRETKQANILPSLFKTITTNAAAGDAVGSGAGGGGAKVILAEGGQEKLLKIIMRLFERVVDLSKPFNITLIGLAFSKFQQRKAGSSSIANYLIKKADLEVQSITSLTNVTDAAAAAADHCSSSKTQDTNNTSAAAATSSSNDDEAAFRSSPTTFQPSDQFYRRRTMAASPIPMLINDNGSESGATNSDFSDFSETEIEPSPKKSRIGRLMAGKRRCFGSTAIYNSENSEIASPSKLRVCDLRLNSRDSEKDFQSCPPNASAAATTTTLVATSPTTTKDGGILESQLDSMPNSCVNESTLEEINLRPTLCATRQLSIASSSPSSSSASPMDECGSGCLPSTTPAIQNSTTTTTTITGNLSNIPCPAGVDPQVFNELPIGVQNELISSWRSSLAAAAVAVVNADVTNPAAVENISSNLSNHQNTTHVAATARAAANAGGAAANAAPKNTLYRYFLRNK